MKPSSWRIYCTKNWQKWTEGKKATAEWSKGVQFFFFFFFKSDWTANSLFFILSKKSLNITLLLLELEDDL